ncbi:MAG TPA: hypothetical protein PK156_51250 [Polyangium sp.]|nr:hypothetical protein [Polyangium sp.]
MPNTVEDEGFIEGICMAKDKPEPEKRAFLAGAKMMAAAIAFTLKGFGVR